MKSTRLFFLSILVFSFVTQGIAQEVSEEVSSELKVYKITANDGGEEVAEEVESITPGDTLEYRVTYTNNLGNAISNLQPMLPIPEGIRYLEDTASPEVSMASLSFEGKNFQVLPIIREETTSSGLIVKREVPASQYRRLQWNVSTLEASESITMSARVQVSQRQQAQAQ